MDSTQQDLVTVFIVKMDDGKKMARMNLDILVGDSKVQDVIGYNFGGIIITIGISNEVKNLVKDNEMI